MDSCVNNNINILLIRPVGRVIETDNTNWKCRPVAFTPPQTVGTASQYVRAETCCLMTNEYIGTHVL